jgi:methyl-accepting chemotaxis protein
MQATSAGEAGRGFATVATEIQRLAENATDATTEIGILIKNIQLDTADTIKTMNHAITQVVEGSKMAENAGSQMRDTQEKSHHLVTLVQQIADSSDNQVQVSKQLQRQAVELKQSNQETSVLLEEQADRSSNLVNYAKSLLKSISVFKIKT